MVPQSVHGKFASLRRYLDWSKGDDEQIPRLRAILMPFAGVFIEDFYAEIVRYPVIAKVITGGDAQIARLKNCLQASTTLTMSTGAGRLASAMWKSGWTRPMSTWRMPGCGCRCSAS